MWYSPAAIAAGYRRYYTWLDRWCFVSASGRLVVKASSDVASRRVACMWRRMVSSFYLTDTGLDSTQLLSSPGCTVTFIKPAAHYTQGAYRPLRVITYNFLVYVMRWLESFCILDPHCDPEISHVFFVAEAILRRKFQRHSVRRFLSCKLTANRGTKRHIHRPDHMHHAWGG